MGSINQRLVRALCYSQQSRVALAPRVATSELIDTKKALVDRNALSLRAKRGNLAAQNQPLREGLIDMNNDVIASAAWQSPGL
jgi:hypothetical protein